MALLEEDVEGSGDEGVGHSHSVVGPGQASGAEDATGALARENLMLKNELNFELYLKSQHLQQMGTLHREHVRETGLEAEIQNLVRRHSSVAPAPDSPCSKRSTGR